MNSANFECESQLSFITGLAHSLYIDLGPNAHVSCRAEATM